MKKPPEGGFFESVTRLLLGGRSGTHRAGSGIRCSGGSSLSARSGSRGSGSGSFHHGSCSRSGSSRSSRFFGFLAASGQSNSSNQGSQQKRLFHIYPQ